MWIEDIVGNYAAWVVCLIGMGVLGITLLERRDQRRRKGALSENEIGSEGATVLREHREQDALLHIARELRELRFEYLTKCQKHDPVQVVQTVVGFFTLALVACYTWLTYQSLQTTRDAYTATQRAFVVVGGLEHQTLYPEPDNWRGFAPVIRNSGNTPATNVEYEMRGISLGGPMDRDAFPGVKIPEPGDPDVLFSLSKAMAEKSGPVADVLIQRAVIGPQMNLPTMPGGASISNVWQKRPENKG